MATHGTVPGGFDCRTRRPEWLEVAVWTAYVALAVADVFTTAWAVFELGFSEANPVVAPVLATHGVAGLAALKTLNIAVVFLIWTQLDRRRMACLAVVVAIEAAIVANTTGVILIMEGVV